MKVLVLGSGSFAARGLTDALTSAGHDVWTFDRGAESATRSQRLQGDLSALTQAARAAGAVDAIINFIVLKGESVEANLAFCETLRGLLEQSSAGRLIHISSISVLAAGSGTVTESALPESNWKKKGEYSQIKIATEFWLREHLDAARLVIVRPGFILGSGLVDPIVGIGKVLPGGWTLGLGVANSVIPLIDRRHLHRALERLLRRESVQTPMTAMLVAPNSPSRREYLEFCARGLGMAAKPVHFSRGAWIGALAVGSIPLAILQRRPVNLVARLAHNLGRRVYDCSVSEQLLGFSLQTDWQKLLIESDVAQRPIYAIPFLVGGPFVRTATRSANAPLRVLYLGLGRIAHERHLPALEKLDPDIEIEWWDPYVVKSSYRGRLRLRKLANPAETKARHAVVVTPAATRLEILTALPAIIETVLCEKPLVSRSDDWNGLAAAVSGRRRCFALHNYRYKPNVAAMAAFLHRFNPGDLEHVRIDFDSPPVASDGARWLRDERRSRTLLMDYAFHFLDLALAFSDGSAVVQECESKRNARGETAAIFARLALGSGSLDLNVRQGVNERKCQLTFVFHNYSCHLRFFPESFFATSTKYSVLDDLGAAWAAARGTWNKLGEKAGWTRAEPSHQRVLGAFLGYYAADAIDALELGRVEGVYRTALALEQIVYGE